MLRDLCWRCLMAVHGFFAWIGHHVKKPAYPFEDMERYRSEYRKLLAENERDVRNKELGSLLRKPRDRSREEILQGDRTKQILDLSDDDSDTDEDEDPLKACMAACNM